MFYPRLTGRKSSRTITDAFPGYVHKLRAREGESYDMENLSLDQYPMLANRKARGLKGTLTNPGGLIEKDALCYVADGTLYVNDYATPITGLSAGEKQLVSMGAYVVIFPDGKYYNTTQDPTEDPTDYGSLGASWGVENATVVYQPCDVDGKPYDMQNAHVGPSEPDGSPANGQIWIDTSEDGHVYRQWSEVQVTWVEIVTVYTKLTFTTMGQIPERFKIYDGVTIEGNLQEDLNGEKILYGVGGRAGDGNEDPGEQDFIVVVGLLDSAFTDESATVSIQRKTPKLDYVCECQNRLWGCYYGMDGDKVLNEIYCSALGDFRNWRQYLGLSTDSWTASVGSDGQWTGAVNYLGNPCFFKENRIHMVSVSSQGAHRLDEIVCRGVQKGSHKSLNVVGETLFYKSRTDVCAWQGGFPQSVSEALGDGQFYNAAAGSYGEKYYISMNTDPDPTRGDWHLFVFDSAKSLWAREDSLHALCLARVDDSLFCIDSDGKLLDLQGAQGTPEVTQNIHWMAESGILGYSYPDHKYLSRYDFTLRLGQGAELSLWIEYDSSGDWIESGRIDNAGMGTRVLPVRPRRCDHLRIRLSGKGEVRLFSIARILEVGSDG